MNSPSAGVILSQACAIILIGEPHSTLEQQEGPVTVKTCNLMTARALRI